MRRFVFMTLAAVGIGCASTSRSNEVRLQPGDSIQAAIDRCEAGAVIHLAKGVYLEQLVIEKPITIVGSGWEESVVGDDAPLAPNVGEYFGGVEVDARAPGGAEPRAHLAPTLTIRNTSGVTIQGLRIRGPNTLAAEGTVGEESLVLIAAAAATLSDCAIVGPSMDGIAILDDSDVRIERCLVAALWGTGVEVRRSQSPSAASARVQLVDCDVRNCYHRCVTTRSSHVTIERSRISGSAWHGIRYDDCSPTIRDNQIFGNARFGIYASGGTAANVRENVFWRNEFAGISCWKTNKDAIEGNTFVGNLRSAIEILDQAVPEIRKNLFVRNEAAVQVNNLLRVPYPGEQDPANPVFSKNLFSENAADFQIAGLVVSLPPGNESAAPPLIAPMERNLVVEPQSRAQSLGVGAQEPAPLASRFPLQPEEVAIIPEGETREYQRWKRTPP